MEQVSVIRHKVLVDGRSIRAVAREMGVSRNTVRRYLGESLPETTLGRPKGSKKTAEIQARMEELLEEWKGRTTRKQRVTGSRLHEELVSEGYDVGSTVVRQAYREWKRQRREVYVPLVHRAGDEAQVDFFEVMVEVGGERRQAFKFLMRSMYSGRDFAWLYDRADQVAFLDGHVRAFEHFGAVPQRCIYDNLSSAVRTRTVPQRELTPRFLALSSHYLFEPCFARPGEGHDKGGVESRGKNIRLQHLTPIPRAESLAAIAEQMMVEIDTKAHDKRDREGRSVIEKFEDDRGQMLRLPGLAFDARKRELCTVSRSSLIHSHGAKYSVPSGWHGTTVTVLVGPEAVEIIREGHSVVHPRCEFGQKSVQYRHYMEELARKPQALRQVAPELLSELGEPYCAFWRLLVDRHGPRDAARVMAKVVEAICDSGEEVVSEVVRRLLESGETTILGLRRPEPQPIQVAVPYGLMGIEVESCKAKDFDWLLGNGGGDE